MVRLSITIIQEKSVLALLYVGAGTLIVLGFQKVGRRGRGSGMSHLRLYMILVLVMFIWGMNLPALKYLTVQMGPVTMTALRIFLASATVFIILYFAKLIRKPAKKEWIYIIVGSLLNVAFHHYFISLGLSLTSGTNASLILGTGPIMTAVFSLLLLQLFPSKWQWLGFILGVCGVAATILAGGTGLSDIS